MGNLGLKHFLGLRVKELPEDLKEKVSQFDNENIDNAQLITWEDFLFTVGVEEDIEDDNFWVDYLNNAYWKDEIEDGLFCVLVNIFNLPGVEVELHPTYPNLALLKSDAKYIVTDADCDSFGRGYILIVKLPDGDADLFCDIAPYEYVMDLREDYIEGRKTMKNFT